METQFKSLQSKAAKITETLDRLKKTHSYLSVSAARQIRIMIGDFTPIVICDSIYSTAEIKKEYLRRLRYRIIELQNQLIELKGQK